MKISTHSPLPIAGAQRPPEDRSADRTTAGFRQVFDAVLDGRTGATPPTAPISTTAPPPLSIDALDCHPAAAGIRRMTHFLETLNAYQQSLADPRCRLRDVAPVLERLETEQRHLANWVGTSAVDASLREIADQALVTAAMEIDRFRSGRYC